MSRTPKYGDGKALNPTDKVLWYEISPGLYAQAVYIGDGAIQIQDENGVGYGVKQINGKMRVSAMSYLYDIAKGNVPDHDPFIVVGYNPDVGTSWETVQDAGGIRNYLTTAQRLQIVSGDADDDGNPPGNGARTVKVIGLDSDWVQYEETVTMNGTTNVATVNSFIRVLHMEVMTAGSTGSNEGIISALDFAGAVTLDTMAVGTNRSHSATYTVPVGHVGYLAQFTGYEASTKGSRFGGFYRLPGGVWTLARQIALLNSGGPVELPLPQMFPEKTDLEMRAIAILSGAVVTASFTGWVEHA